MINATHGNYHGSSRRGALAAAALSIVGLLATAYFAAHERTDSQREARREFDAQCREIQAKIDLRLAAHEQILRSAAAFFADSDGVSRSEWREFAERQKIDQRLPGIQGLGFAQVVPSADLAAHTSAVRAEGYPGYRIWPEGERATYTTIIYLEPFVGRNLRAFGYDMLTEPVRRAAMERARDEDSISLTGKVTLVQEDGQDVQPGTLMYAPVYRLGARHTSAAERRASLIGWVYSPYRMRDLISAGIFGSGDSTSRRKIRLEIFDGQSATPANLLYDSHPRPAASEPPPGTIETVVEHAGREWRLRFSSVDSAGVSVDYGGFWLLVASGTLVSTLFAALVFSWANTRHAARLMAARLTTELRESEERHRTLIESSPEAVTVHRRGIIIYVNPAAIRFAGATTAADLLGTPLIERVHPDSRPLVLARVKQMTEQHTSVPLVEMKFLKLDGTPFDVEVQATEINYDGEPAIRVVARDITDYKRAVAALRLSEENYRLLFEGMLDGFALHEIICDAAGRPVDYRFLSVNPAFERLTGLRGTDVIGRTVRELMPAIESAWIERYGRVALTGVGIEFEDFSADLGKHFEIAAFRPRPGQFATVFIDVTASRRAEAALRDSEERFRVLFEGAPDAMLLADASTGLIVAANAAASELLGRSRPELVGAHQTSLHPPHTHDAAQALFERHVREAGTFRSTAPVETTVLRPDGTEISVEILAQTILLQARTVIIGTFRDITVRKQAEAALQSSQELIGGILNTIPARVFWKDQHLVYLGCNVSFAQDAGFADPSDIVGKDDFQMGWRNEAELYRADDRLVIASGQPKLFIEETQTTPDGKTIVLLTSKLPLRNALGEITGVLGTYTDITKWKQSETALRESEERFRTLFDRATEGILLTTAEGHVLAFNEAFARMHGYTVPELARLDVRKLGPAGSDDAIADRLARLAAGEYLNFEVEHTHQSGRVISLEVSSSQIAIGGQILTQCFYRDISARKQSESALRASEEQFRSYIEHAPMGVFISDATGTYIQANAAAAETTGYSVAELLTMGIPDLLPPGAEAVSHAHFQRLMQTGQSSGETSFRRKDGTVGYWFVDAVRLSPTRYLAFTVETTARKEAEQKLAESRDLLANLARLVPGVVYQYRLYPDGRSAFPFSSPGMHEIYELSPAEVREDATPVFGRLHPDDADRVSAAIFDSARTLDEFFCEFRVVLPHQGLRWRWCQAHPERTPDGGTLWHGIISDITDRKEAELDLHASLSEKEALLKEVHHRVKNNLQVIMSLLRMEGRRSTEPATKSVLGEMQSRIRSMALLHESLYRSGTFAAVDLSNYLSQLATQAFRSAQTSPHAVRLELTLTPVLVEMDQALPCGLLVNELLSNALKHAFPGGRPGCVHVDLQPLATEPGRWCLAVSDNGVGLPADLELRRNHSLGLQLVADLAGQLHGTLAVSAAPGDTGTRLAVTFSIMAPPTARP